MYSQKIVKFDSFGNEFLKVVKIESFTDRIVKLIYYYLNI